MQGKVSKVTQQSNHKEKFSRGQQVLVFNSRLKIFPDKFKDQWSGPYTVRNVCPNGVLELYHSKSGDIFKVNGHRAKPYMHYPDQNLQGAASMGLAE